MPLSQIKLDDSVFDSPVGGYALDTCCMMPDIVFTQLQIIRITLWLCAVTLSRCGAQALLISNEGKKPFGAKPIPDIFPAFTFISDRQQPHQLAYYSNILH